MWLSSSFGKRQRFASKARGPSPACKRPGGQARLIIEPLEERTVPSFFPAVNYAVGPGPNTVVVADLRGDGKLDIATANSGSNTVSVHLGNGNGTFQRARNFVAGKGANYLAVGDFRGDGRLDLVTLNYTDNDVSVLLGNGNGTFQASKNFFLPRGIHGDVQSPRGGVAVADLNHDGKLDLVITAEGVKYPQYGYVDVFLGNGDGTFSPKATYLLSAPSPQYSLALEDVLGHRTPDLIVANYSRNTISLFPGKGDGTFGTPLSIGTGPNPVGIAVGDLNRDGKLDIVVANSGSTTITELLNQGGGKFQAHNYTVGRVPDGVVLADFNRDGKLDVATDNILDSDVSVLLGNGNGTFQSAQSYRTNVTPWWIASGDFNHDGYPDLVTCNKSVNDVSVLINNRIWTATTVFLSDPAGSNIAKPSAAPSTLSAAASVDAHPGSTAILTSQDLTAPKAGFFQRIIPAHPRVRVLDQVFSTTPLWPD
jgi:hypothetical protein